MTPGAPKRRRTTKLPQVQRVAAYAVVLRDDKILLSRLSDTLVKDPVWTLPGGGVDHGEDPRAAVVREVHEETGLPVEIGETAWVFSAHRANTWRRGRRVDAHALRIVYDGWVPVDAPEPHTVEVGGSTAEAAWVPVADVLSGEVPTLELVTEALAVHRPFRMQRVAAYALVVRGLDTASPGGSAGSTTDGGGSTTDGRGLDTASPGGSAGSTTDGSGSTTDGGGSTTDGGGAAGGGEVLLTRISSRGFHSGAWTLPGGGVGFGESPRAALVREVMEECGVVCEVGEVLEVDDVAVTGTAPSGRHEDFHGVHLVFAASVVSGDEPRVVESDGTTDAVAWVPLADVESGRIEVLDVVRSALAAYSRR